MALARASDASNWKMEGRSVGEIPADEFKYAEAAILPLDVLQLLPLVPLSSLPSVNVCAKSVSTSLSSLPDN